MWIEKVPVILSALLTYSKFEDSPYSLLYAAAMHAAVYEHKRVGLKRCKLSV